MCLSGEHVSRCVSKSNSTKDQCCDVADFHSGGISHDAGSSRCVASRYDPYTSINTDSAEHFEGHDAFTTKTKTVWASAARTQREKHARLAQSYTPQAAKIEARLRIFVNTGLVIPTAI